MIRPAVEAATEGHPKRIGILATYTTVASESFVREIKKVDQRIEVYQQVCPLLVPIIEEGEFEWKGLDLILDKYLSPIITRGVERVILGCTHYELIADKVRQKLNGIDVIPEGKVTAEKLADYLQRHPEIQQKLSQNRKRTYLVTDINERYQQLVSLFWDSLARYDNRLQLVSL